MAALPVHASAPSPSPSPTPTPTPVAWSNAVFSSDELIKEGAEGDLIVVLQTRLADLGFFNFKTTGFFGSSTKEALASFQRTNALAPDGVLGAQTAQLLFSNVAARGYGERGKPTPTPKPGASATGKYGEMIEWDQAKRLVKARTQTITITDYATGVSWKAVRLGGDLHMDIEPKTKADTALMKKAVGGRWSWSRRAVLVTINGKLYAGSINSYPHSPERVLDNDYAGHHCLHFYKSRVHKTGNVDPEHQRCVRRAAGK